MVQFVQESPLLGYRYPVEHMAIVFHELFEREFQKRDSLFRRHAAESLRKFLGLQRSLQLLKVSAIFLKLYNSVMHYQLKFVENRNKHG